MTRSRPKIDRIACPWLIRRFADPRAVFLYVAPAEVVGVAELFGAMPYDIEDVFRSHRGEPCTFDAMLAGFGHSTPALERLAPIVRGADTARMDLAPEAAGPLAASLGLSRMYADDLEQLEAGMVLHDALCRRARDATDETHDWPAKPARPDMTAIDAERLPASAHPTLGQATRVWARVALLSFGGPAGQIAVMHRILVEEKRWIGDGRFLHALNFCMLLPGPEAQQLATYIGWLMHRTWGGAVAGTLFVLPGLVSIMALSVIYALYGEVGTIDALFFGLKAAVLAIVLQAVVRIGGRAIRNGVMLGVAALSFVAIFGFAVPFPLIVLVAALTGWIGARAGIAALQPGGGHGSVGRTHVADADTLLGEELGTLPRDARRAALLAGGAALALWLVPVLALMALAGPASVFTDIAVFFSKMAVVTFGGAYAVLAYVAQEAVGTYGWLAPGEMLDGLGMAETTPGPLIMVTQFVGFMGAFRDPGALSPVAAGVFGGLLTTWVTFAPCFAWIFLGAPFMEGLRSNRALSAALATVTAAVVGVILNLAVWFALHVVFDEVRVFEGAGLRLDVPVLASVDPAAALLSATALVAVFRLRLGMLTVLGGAAAVGVLLHLAGLA